MKSVFWCWRKLFWWQQVLLGGAHQHQLASGAVIIPPSHHQQGNHHHRTHLVPPSHPTTNICLPCCNCCTSVVHSSILSVLLVVVDIFNPRHFYIYIDMIIRCNDSLSVIQVHFPFYLSRCYCQAVTDPEKRQVSGADITLGQVSAWQVTKPWPIWLQIWASDYLGTSWMGAQLTEWKNSQC